MTGSILAYTIVPASLRDLGPLRHLERVCFPQDAWSVLDLIGVLSFANVVRLKAVSGGVPGQMVGFVAGDIRRDEGLAWISTIGVLPEYRGQGIGSALLRACEARLPPQDGRPLAVVRLCVRRSNEGAIRLYEREGYGRIGEWSDYYQDGEAALVLEKRLG